MANETMVYKHPGPHEIHGDSFDYKIVDADDADSLEVALAEGWHLTTTEAKASPVDAPEAPKEVKVRKKA